MNRILFLCSTPSLTVLLSIVAVTNWRPVAAQQPVATSDKGEAAEGTSHGAATRAFRGIVRDEMDQPIAGATIETVDGFGRPTYRATSLANGAFLLRVPSEGYYGDSLLVKDPSGERASFRSGYNFTTDRNEPLKIVLRPLRMTEVLVVDTTGNAVAGALVYLIAEHENLATLTSDENGVVKLAFPADAKVDWITALKDGMGFDYYENYDAFPSQERLEVPPQVQLTLNGARTVQVQVIDSLKNPVAGVYVTPWTIAKHGGKLSYVNFSGQNSGKTDADGRIRFAWLPSDFKGRIEFSIHHSKYHCPKQPAFTLEEPDETELTTIVYRNATIRGHVTHADGEPAVGIRLQGEGRGNTNMYFRGHTSTKPDGSYEIDVFPDQETVVAITDDTFAAKSATGIKLKPGELLENVNFELGPGSLIQGTITIGDQHQPMVDQTATLIQSNTLVRWNKTNKLGQYQFRVGPGDYTLRLAKSDEINLTVTDELKIMNDQHIDRLPRGTLSGMVVDRAGQPVGDAEVFGESIAAVGHAGFKTVTDANGEFRSERWNDDQIVVATQTEFSLAGMQPVGAADQTMRIVVSPAASVVGKVVDAEQKPLAGCYVMLEISTHGVGRHPSRRMTTDKEGRYEFKAIPIGESHRIRVITEANPQAAQTKTFDAMVAERIELETILYE